MIGAAFMAAPACAPPPAAQVADEPTVEDLPPYTEADRLRFGDTLAHELFGLDVSERPLLENARFVDSVRTADRILRVRLKTIRAETFETQTRYHLVLRPTGEAPLTGAPLESELTLTVGVGSPSLPLLRSMDVNIVGRELVVMLKRYQHEGRAVVHFRAEPATASVLQAVEQVLGEKI